MVPSAKDRRHPFQRMTIHSNNLETYSLCSLSTTFSTSRYFILPTLLITALLLNVPSGCQGREPDSPSPAQTTLPSDLSTALKGSAPRNVQGRPLSGQTILLQWDPPEESGGQVTGYKIFYTTSPVDPISKWETQTVDNNQMTTLTHLKSYMIYTIKVQALTQRGPGPFSSPVQAKTQQGVPGQPHDVRAIKVTASSVHLSWKKPAHSRHAITGYELYWNDSYTQQEGRLSIPAVESFTLGDLLPDTQYWVWISGKSVRGEGAASHPIPVKTEKFVPPEPRDVKVTVINSTTIEVQWKAPFNREQNGLILGYQIYLSEINKRGEFVNEPLRYDVADGLAESFNVTGLQPDTEYSVRIATVSRKGDGNRSKAVKVRTAGGVPTRPNLLFRLIQDEPLMSVEIEWARPNHTYGTLLGYRLRYGKIDVATREERDIPPNVTASVLKELERGVRYEVRLAGKNHIGLGQEAVTFIETPEGPPSSPPVNITHRLQSPTTVAVDWEPPPNATRNGKITGYGVHWQKTNDNSFPNEIYTSNGRMVFSTLDENQEYSFKVRAYTSKGPGPWSQKYLVVTPQDAPPAPTGVQAMATSETSVEVWWEEVKFFDDIIGFRVLYTQQAVEDLDLWTEKLVPMTNSAELKGLESGAMYAIRVGAQSSVGTGKLSEFLIVRLTPTDVVINLRAHEVTTHTMTLSWKQPTKLNPMTYRITYAAQKEFYDSQGLLQELPVPSQEINLEPNASQVTIGHLMPFTSYQVNVTAVPFDGSYRPPAKITVTTAMAAPKPMVKPDSLGSQNGKDITVVLPQGSEEFGPISHYFLIVVPQELANKNPDYYSLEELSSTPIDSLGPYIAAKFPRRTMPSTFTLGDGIKYGGFLNRVLRTDVNYQIFVRAVVDTPQKSLFTSSPFSDPLNVNMLPQTNAGGYAPHPYSGGVGGQSGPNISLVSSKMDASNVLTIVACFVLGTIVLAIVILAGLYAQSRYLTSHMYNRRRQLMKTPAANETTMKLLVNPMESRMDLHHQTNGHIIQSGHQTISRRHPHQAPDPVELRRLNYQTPGMLHHPPIPVTELGNHIERLKANDNMKFSQEFESIDPGQQFTWEHSNLDYNKPKNRYANVVAYDHSRVVLQPLDGVPGSDYINANYCDGYRKANAYIATQGPLPGTIGDFWRMVWEQKSYAVVMMTKLEERARVKCDQYWPNMGTESYGVMHVTLTHVEELPTYCIRTFLLQRTGYMESREVKQFQFTAWPDHGVPDHPSPFLMFLRRIRSLTPPDAGPSVIHCSAGVGRTGCYIVIDSMLERINYEPTVDIYGHVVCLRAQRNYSVQTEDQYIFIHDAILEAIMGGNAEVPSPNMYNHLQVLYT